MTHNLFFLKLHLNINGEKAYLVLIIFDIKIQFLLPFFYYYLLDYLCFYSLKVLGLKMYFLTASGFIKFQVKFILDQKPSIILTKFLKNIKFKFKKIVVK